MAKSKNGARKPGLLQQDMDNKVYSLIDRLLDEKTSLGMTRGPFNSALARHLKGEEVFTYVKANDRAFTRIRDEILRKSIDRSLTMFVEEEEEEIKGMNIDLTTLDNGGNGEEASQNEDDNLVDYPDTNQANKAIVSLWQNNEDNTNNETASQQTDGTPIPTNGDWQEAATTSTTEYKPESEKKKRKSKDSSSGKSKKLKKDRTPPSTTLDSLGGLGDVTKELLEVVGMPIMHPEIYLSTGIEPPRGVLLHGPPGCGKTTIANALAGTLQVPFISLSAPSVVSGMSGESEKKLREIFEEAKQLAPCLVFFDEIDAITPKRDGGAQREMERRIVAQLLTSMDELSLDKTGGKPVIVIGATNRPDSLDAALRRAGRFDREISINVPDEGARYNILQSMTCTVKCSGELGLRQIAKMTPGFVGADLKALVGAAGVEAINRIFSTLNELEEQKNHQESSTNNEDAMEIDEQQQQQQLEKIQKIASALTIRDADFSALSTIQKFLLRHPEPLTNEQLEPLRIIKEDFLTALPKIQPTAKREGFATIPDVTWASVGALSRIRVELHMAIVQPIKRPEIYEKVGITAPAGVLMWGPPGCGKTLLAKAVANESKANFISVKGPELLNKYVGESEKAVRKVFARARASVPCIIFFDELDALVPRRDTSLSEASSRVVNTLLTELDGLNERKGIFVIGATNRPDMIDAAMLRPGRLDKLLYVELPTANERLEILKTLVNVNNTPLDPAVNLETVAHDEKCRNFSGADLSSLVRQAGTNALQRKIFTNIQIGVEEIKEANVEDLVVDSNDFMKALSDIKPSVSDRDRQKYERLNRRMGWDKTVTSNDDSNKADSV